MTSLAPPKNMPMPKISKKDEEIIEAVMAEIDKLTLDERIEIYRGALSKK